MFSFGFTVVFCLCRLLFSFWLQSPRTVRIEPKLLLEVGSRGVNKYRSVYIYIYIQMMHKYMHIHRQK